MYVYIYICIWAPVKILYISVVVIIGIAFWRGAYLFSVCCVIIAVRGQYRFTTVFRAHLWQTNYNTKVVFNHFDRDSSYCIFYHEIPRHIIHIPLKYVGHYLLCLNLFLHILSHQKSRPADQLWKVPWGFEQKTSQRTCHLAGCQVDPSRIRFNNNAILIFQYVAKKPVSNHIKLLNIFKVPFQGLMRFSKI